MEWLQETKRVVFCTWCKDNSGEELRPVHATIQALLAEFFGIDEKQLEEEKQDMLAQLRCAAEENSNVD
ncbi:MAG: hypothetical protein DRJ03_01975 [Chloroflexi bacterium]|nr:MAG: hypothetical protein DRJ03_01975 [Chloroflexota bacterium]